jgi:hypothetical protein
MLKITQHEENFHSVTIIMHIYAIARIPTRTLAAALSICRDFKMVAPSLVTVTSCPLPVDCSILSCPSSLTKP